MNRSPSSPDKGEFWTARRFLLALSLVVLLTFLKVALGLNTFFYRDFGALGYPGAYYLRESLQHGELPLWNPYSHCGVPYMAQMGQWYLPAWVCTFLPLPWSVNFPILLHLILGGFGMYTLARRWGTSGFAASFAGFAYAFNGISLSCFQWGNYIEAIGWLPWVLLWVGDAWRQGGRKVVLAALASAMLVLTATPELTLLAWCFLAVLWAGEVFRKEIKIWPTALRVAGVIGIAAGITMVQMLPFFDLLAHSQRNINYEAEAWSMPGYGWANLFVPLFHYYHSSKGIWFQTGQEFFISYYLGMGVMVLGIAGAFWTRTRLSITLTAMALFCWIMALGSQGHLYAWVKNIFPYIGVARFTIKFTLLTSFLIPLLAAWAIDRISADPRPQLRRGLLLIAGSALLLTAILVWFARQYPFSNDAWSGTAVNALWRTVLMLAMIGAVLFLTKLKNSKTILAVQLLILGTVLTDALTHSPNIVPTLPSSSLAPGIWQSGKDPAPKLGEGRIMISPEAEQALSYSRVPRFDYDFVGKRLAEWYNLNLLDMIPKVTGAITLRPAHFDLIEQYLYYTPGTSYSSGLLDFLSAAWFSSPANPVDWSARTNFLPVMTAGQKPIYLDDNSALAGMIAKNFDPRTTVFLPTAEHSLVSVSNTTICTLHDVRFAQNHIEATTTAEQPSLVVLSQTFYHLWQVEVDGRSVPLLRANVAFEAVQVPAGTHQLKLIYRDLNFKIGAAISVLSLLICGWIWWRQPPLRGTDKNI